MTKQTIIEKTVLIINQLPEDKTEEIFDFADFLMKRHEEYSLNKDIQNMLSQGNSFDFLNQEEELYSEEDIKEKYNE